MTITDIAALPAAIGALLRGDEAALREALARDEEPANTEQTEAAVEAAH